MSDPSDISPCGRYRIVQATYASAKRIIDDLSTAEDEERKRLGIKKYSGSLEQAASGEAWMVVENGASPLERAELCVFGVTAEGYVWMLPSNEEGIKQHKGAFLSRTVASWVLQWIWSIAPEGTNLFNGCSPEATGIMRWLKKVVGARFLKETVPSATNGHPVFPFILHRKSNYV